MTQGLWNIGGFNLPDLGISETLGLDRIGIPNNAAVYPKGQEFNTDYVTPSGQKGNTVQDVMGASSQVFGPPSPKTFTQSGLSTGSVGNATLSGGGGGDSQLTQLQKIAQSGGLNPYQQAEYDKLLAAQNNSAEAQRAAALSRANTEFDRNRAALELQLSGLGDQKTNALNEIETGLSGVRTQVDSSRQNSRKNTDTQIQQAGSIAQSTQDQNRRVLRALGIINSTAAGELLTKPMNEFDKQRSNLQEIFVQRSNELDQFMDQKAAEANNAKNSIISQYTQAYNAIQNDLRFNDRQRLDAIQAINAQAQQHLADIQTQVFNYQNQVNLQKQNFAQGLAQIAAYQNPSIASNYLDNYLLSNTGQGVQTAQIFDPNKKEQKNTLFGN